MRLSSCFPLPRLPSVDPVGSRKQRCLGQYPQATARMTPVYHIFDSIICVISEHLSVSMWFEWLLIMTFGSWPSSCSHLYLNYRIVSRGSYTLPSAKSIFPGFYSVDVLLSWGDWGPESSTMLILATCGLLFSALVSRCAPMKRWSPQ